MNIKNNVSLSIAEAVELLAKIADSLEQKGEFAFDLKGQEVSMESGEQLNAILSLSPTEFSIIFNWGQAEDEGMDNWSAQSSQSQSSEQEYYEPPKMVREVNLPDEKPSSTPRIGIEEPVVANNTPRRALPDRMPLNTTTLPLDAGYWASAFTSNEGAQWSRLEINDELENKKWGSDDQITSLSDLTPEPAKPKSIRSTPARDDDLFSELDELDNKKPKNRSTPGEGVEKVQIPDRAAVQPAAKVRTIPKPSSVGSTSAIPAATPGASSGQQRTTQDLNWREPKAEDNSTNDSWVKPSQVLRKQDSSTPPTQQNIPSPSSGGSPVQSSKRQSIPVPSSSIPEPKPSSSSPASAEIINEVREWKEPTPEENVTDDDWIRPSEFLKRAETAPPEKKAPDVVNKPPPVAPDKKKDKDEEKKGWASWD